MTLYNKLVRDKIPKIIQANGGQPITHIADKEEYAAKLHDKLREEVNEYLAEQNPEELADILEVIQALARRHGLSSAQLEQLRLAKAAKRGAFTQRVILDEA